MNSSSPDIDAWILLKFVLQVDDAWLISNEQTLLDPQDEDRVRKLVDFRNSGVPVPYLTNSREFWSQDLHVNSRVLVPRPETETLVEVVLNTIRSFLSPTILELGTGSGAIAIALSIEIPHAEITATDLSRDALAIAKINLERYHCTNVKLEQTDWFSGLEGRKFHLICANPPYIACNDPHLEAQELQYEPKSALVSGEDGLDAIRQISSESSDYLHPNGWLILEHGYDQTMQVHTILRTAGFVDIRSEKDLMGHDRVSLGRRSEESDDAQGCSQ